MTGPAWKTETFYIAPLSDPSCVKTAGGPSIRPPVPWRSGPAATRPRAAWPIRERARRCISRSPSTGWRRTSTTPRGLRRGCRVQGRRGDWRAGLRQIRGALREGAVHLDAEPAAGQPEVFVAVSRPSTRKIKIEPPREGSDDRSCRVLVALLLLHRHRPSSLRSAAGRPDADHPGGRLELAAITPMITVRISGPASPRSW